MLGRPSGTARNRSGSLDPRANSAAHGDWIAGEVPQEAAHPGYFLPTVAGGLVGPGAAAVFRMHTLAEFGSA